MADPPPPPTHRSPDPGLRGEFDRVLRDGLVSTVYQPVVDLDSLDVVGHEALTRGPRGPLEMPDRLFAEARRTGRVGELDDLCRRSALQGAAAAGIAAPSTLFVNVEPSAIGPDALAALTTPVPGPPDGVQVVLELTERALASRPAQLLAATARLRQHGWKVALDDVGADDVSLGFMALLRPEVVKLDLGLVQRRPDPDVASIMNAVNAYAERYGAVVVAEGIEHAGHLATARALGATHGQGWMFGRPQPRVRPTEVRRLELPTRPDPVTAVSPFACLPPRTRLRRATKPLLVQVSRHLEREAVRHGDQAVVLATFQEARNFGAATAARFHQLARRAAFVGVLGAQMPSEPAPGVTGAALQADEPMTREWDIVVLAPHFAAALLAEEITTTGHDDGRTFDFALTYDRDVVVAAARTLMTRIVDGVPGSAAGAGPARPRVPALWPSSDRGATDAEHTLRRALAATVNGVTVVDVTRPDQPLVYVNAAFERLAGRPAAELLGRNCRVLQGQDTDPSAVGRLRRAVREGRPCQVTLLNYRGEQQEPWWNEVHLEPVHDEDGRLVQYIGVQNDVTAQVTAEAALREERDLARSYASTIEQLAWTDPLTGLLNRRRLQQRFEAELLETQVAGTGLAVLYIDLDGFKAVNDAHGHRAGDDVLREVARRLRQHVRRTDVVARFGGDEFLVVMTGLDPGQALAEGRQLARTLDRVVGEPMTVRDDVLTVRASIGVSAAPQHGSDLDSLLHVADAEMYATKGARTRDGSARDA